MIACPIIKYDNNYQITGNIEFKQDKIYKICGTDIPLVILYIEESFDRESWQDSSIIKTDFLCNIRKANLEDLTHKKLLWLSERYTFIETKKGLALKVFNKFATFEDLLKLQQFKALLMDERLI